MPLNIDRDPAQQAYTDVRNDNDETTWVLLKYSDENKSIVFHKVGVDYDEMLTELNDDDRAYGYVRMVVGDELSKRAKFVMVTWIGPSVPVLKKAAVSIDKAFVKEIFQQFTVEICTDDKGELNKESLEVLLRKAGGANYGTGVRD